jgi:hypothetical protein
MTRCCWIGRPETRDTPYATELVTAEIDGNRIERIFVKAENQHEIRFLIGGLTGTWPAPAYHGAQSLLRYVGNPTRGSAFKGTRG